MLSLARGGRSSLADRLAMFTDARVERWWIVLGVLDGRPSWGPSVPAAKLVDRSPPHPRGLSCCPGDLPATPPIDLAPVGDPCAVRAPSSSDASRTPSG